MNKHNEVVDSNLEIGERLVKQYFWFLVDKFGFIYYDKYGFRSKKIAINILPGHKTPRIDVIRNGELDPDLFKLNFEWIIKFFHGAFPSDKQDYLKHSLEENMIFISKIFRENSQKLIEDFDSWWIPAHLYFYRAIEKQYGEQGQTERFHKNYKYYHDYLKSKGAL